MKEIIIKIMEDGDISVEENENGIKSYKRIEPEGLIKCINQSLFRGGVSSGLLPRGCLSFSQEDNGNKGICLIFPDNKADISYHDTVYKDFPLPKLVFGFRVSSEGRVYSCSMGITENVDFLKPDSKMYLYPFSNVSGFSLCTGNNSLPKCKSLHTIGSLPYFILSMPNNNDHFNCKNNKKGLEMRDLLELIKDKQPEYYYSDILLPMRNVTLNDFINQRRV